MLWWIGLVLCTLAAARYWRESRSVLQVDASEVAWLVGSLIGIWALAIASWQQVMRFYGGERIRLVDAARHLALLLLGKYLPGGIWGFAARLADTATHRPLLHMVAAGIAEQWLGLASLSLLSIAGIAAAETKEISWLLIAFLVPPIAIGTLVLVQACVRRFSQVLPEKLQQFKALPATLARRRPLWGAAVLSTLQQALTLALVAGVAFSIFSLDVPFALGVAGTYGLAVVAGILVVFMPGGILVREGVFVALSSHWLRPDQAIAFAAALRLVFTASDLFAGIMAGGLQLTRMRRV